MKIHTHKYCSIILGLFYCPSQSATSVWDDLAHCVCQLRQIPDISLLLGGDFNCPGIDWCTVNLTELSLPLLFQEQDFLLEQIILQPTRDDNILD